MNSLYIPFKQVSFSLKDNQVTVSSPWTTVVAEVDADALPSTIQAVESIQQHNYENEESVKFLDFFKSEFLAYPKPRNAISKALSNISTNFENIQNASPIEILRAVNAKASDTLEQKLSFIDNEWLWDHSYILNESKINENLFDPITLMSLIKSFQLIDQVDIHKALDLPNSLAGMRKDNESDFLRKANISISQTLYVTKRCRECIEPAISHSSISEKIKAFLASEANHDRLMQHSLAGLPTSDPAEPLAHTILLMDILKLCARDSITALSCMLNSFEGLVEQDIDMLAEELKQSSFSKSANGLLAHLRVNKAQDHHSFSETLLENVGAITKQEAIFIIKMNELNSRLVCDQIRAVFF